MRRIFVLLLTVALSALCLSGCRGFKDEPRPEDRLLVTALGFDHNGEEYILTAETVRAEKEENTLGSVSGEGEKPEAAFGRLAAKSLLPLSFSHTATVVFGRGITLERAEEIRALLTAENDFPLSAVLVFADSAGELLSEKTADGEPRGLKIEKLLLQKSRVDGIGGHTALFEISTALLQSVPVFALPVVRQSGDSLEIGELRVVGEDTQSEALSYEESLCYTLMRNIFEGGEITFEGERFAADKVRVKLKAELHGGRLKLMLNVGTKENGRTVAQILENTLNAAEEDVFGIKSEIYKADKSVFWEIYDDYGRFFKEKTVEVEVEE